MLLTCIISENIGPVGDSPAVQVKKMLRACLVLAVITPQAVTPQVWHAVAPFALRRSLGLPKKSRRIYAVFLRRSSPKAWRTFCPLQLWRGQNCGLASSGGYQTGP